MIKKHISNVKPEGGSIMLWGGVAACGTRNTALVDEQLLDANNTVSQETEAEKRLASTHL